MASANVSERKLRPVGRCIYCLREDLPLADEHIIPLGLNGALVLPQASCRVCADLTSQIELALLRGEMRSVRAALSFNTRRPKEMPKSLPLLVTKGGVEELTDAPIGKHLAILVLPLYSLPGFVKPYDFAKGIALIGFQTVHFGDPDELLRRHAAEKIGVEQKLDKDVFARFLAKVAYGLAVAEFGLERFETVYVLPTIRGQMEQAGRWIGSSDGVLAPMAPDVQHSHQVQTFCSANHDESKLVVVVHLRLFANVPSPMYSVFVGEINADVI